MRRVLALFGFFLLCSVTLSSSSLAQETPAVVPTATPEAIIPDSDLRSPRVTVATFLAAMDPSDGEIEIARAIKTLDSSDISELVRSEHEEEIAVKLYAILSFKGLTSSKMPSTSTEDLIQISEVGGTGIYLSRTGPNWRFSKHTVANVPTIFREVEPKLSKRDMLELADASNTWLTIRMYVPERLKNTTLFLEDWQWLAGLLAVVLLIALQRASVRACRWMIIQVLPPRFGIPSAANLTPLGRPIGVVITTTALQLFLLTLDLPIDAYTLTVQWISTIRVIALTVLAIYLVDVLGQRLSFRSTRTPSTIDDILYPLIQKASWLLVILVGIAQVLSIHGVDVSGLVAGLGLGGLAFALAAKDTIENIFGSIAILIDQPFRVGDAIHVSGVTGTVEQIGLRSTRLRTPDNSVVSMPNSKVIAGHVDNLGVRPYARTKITIQLAYDTKPPAIEALCDGIRELLRSHPLCKQDAIAVFLNEFNATSLGLLVQFHLFVKEWAAEQAAKEEIYLAILRLIHELGISLATTPQELRIAKSLHRQSDPPSLPSSTDAMRAAHGIAAKWKRQAIKTS